MADKHCHFIYGKYKWALSLNSGTWHKIVIVDGQEYPRCKRKKRVRFKIVKRTTRRPHSLHVGNGCMVCCTAKDFK